MSTQIPAPSYPRGRIDRLLPIDENHVRRDRAGDRAPDRSERPSSKKAATASSMKDMIMNKKLFGALGAVAILAGAAVAFQFAVSSPPSENLVAQRIEGRWVLDADITARLDAQRGFLPP